MNKHIKTQVKQILEQSEAARNSDAVLTIELYRRFYYMQDPVTHAKLIDIMRYCNPYDITRYRKKYNSQGLYLPTSEEVIKARRLKIEDMREDLGYPTGSTVQERMDWLNR